MKYKIIYKTFLFIAILGVGLLFYNFISSPGIAASIKKLDTNGKPIYDKDGYPVRVSNPHYTKYRKYSDNVITISVILIIVGALGTTVSKSYIKK